MRCSQKILLTLCAALMITTAGCSKPGPTECSSMATESNTQSTEAYQEVVPCEYDLVYLNSLNDDDTYIMVSSDNKFGMYAKEDGSYTLRYPVIYDKITYSNVDHSVKVILCGETSYFDSEGNKIQPDDIPFLKTPGGNRFYSEPGGRAYGLKSSEGTVLLSPRFDTVEEAKPGYYIVSQNMLKGVIDEQGREVIPAIYKDVQKHDTLPYWIVVDAVDGMYGALDEQNRQVISIIYYDLTPTDWEKYPFVATSMTPSGVMIQYPLDVMGNPILSDQEYHYVQVLNENRFLASSSEGYGIVSAQGETVVPFEYQLMTFSEEGELGIYWKENQKGLINSDGVLLGEKYTDIFRIGESHKYAVVFKDGKYGCLNSRGEIIAPLEYDWISATDTGPNVAACRDGKVGFINLETGEDCYFHYERASVFHRGYAQVMQDGKLGWIDEKGDSVVPCQYHYAEGESPQDEEGMLTQYYQKDLYGVSQNGRWGVIRIP